MTTIRRPGVASISALTVLCVSFAITNAAAPEWSHRVGLDVWNYSEAEHSHESAKQRSAEIETKANASARRRDLANQHARSAILNRTPLAEYTEALMGVFAHESGFSANLEASYRDVRDERLRFALHAISRCERLLEHDSAKREETLARFRVEYAQMVAGLQSPAQ